MTPATVRRCRHCDSPLAADAHPSRRYCGDVCRDLAAAGRAEGKREDQLAYLAQFELTDAARMTASMLDISVGECRGCHEPIFWALSGATIKKWVPLAPDPVPGVVFPPGEGGYLITGPGEGSPVVALRVPAPPLTSPALPLCYRRHECRDDAADCA